MSLSGSKKRSRRLSVFNPLVIGIVAQRGDHTDEKEHHTQPGVRRAGALCTANAIGMSPNTIRNFRTTFAVLQAFFLDDPAFEAITRDQLIDFPAGAWLCDEYLSEPDGVAPRGQIKLSPNTVLNVHTDPSGLWIWGVEEGFVRAVALAKGQDGRDGLHDALATAVGLGDLAQGGDPAHGVG
jgi:hypothetical protein